MPKTPLNPSPLTVISQNFWEVKLLAAMTQEYDAGDLDIEHDVQPLPDSPNQWRVVMQVKLAALDGQKPPPYAGHIIAEGRYQVHEQYPYDPERLIRITGASMLYGAIREMTTSITARGPHGMLTLPSVSFYEDSKKAKKKAPKKKPAKKVAKKRATKSKK
jgi:preprotein translocase subunit SecB